MRKTTCFLIVLMMSGFAGCVIAASGSPESDKPFVSWYMSMVQKIKAKPALPQDSFGR